VALLRLQVPAGLIAALLLVLPGLQGCGGRARTLVSATRPAAPAGTEKVAFLAPYRGREESEFKRAVLGWMVKAFLESGRYTVLPLPEGKAGAEAAAIGADLLLVLGDGKAACRWGRHHVHSYLEGSASGEASLIDLRSGAIVRLARENVSASARAHYTTPEQIRDHLARRLAHEMAWSLLHGTRDGDP
jgi:hypothetical protein